MVNILDINLTTPPSNTFWLGVSIDAFFTASYTILVLLIGVWINWWYERKKKRKELTTLKEYMCYLGGILNEPLTKQIDSLRNFSVGLKSLNSQNFAFIHYPRFNISNIQAIKHSDLYDIFLKDKKKTVLEKSKNFQRYQEGLHLFDFITKQYPKDFEEFKAKERQYMELWNEGMTTLQKYYQECASIITAKGVNEGEDPLIEGIYNLLEELGKNEDYQNENIVIEVLIKPLRELCKDHIGDNRSPAFLNSALKCIYAYKSLTHNRNSYALHFEKTADLLDKARTEFNESIQSLDCKSPSLQV